MANTWILSGVVGDDPEVSYTDSGTAYCRVTIKETYGGKDKESGEWVDRTAWHHITLWGKQAENEGRMLAKGMAVIVSAPVRPHERRDLAWANGSDKAVRVPEADFGTRIEIVGAVAAQSNSTSRPSGPPREPGPTRAARQAQPVDHGGAPTEPTRSHGGPPPDDDDDSLPF